MFRKFYDVKCPCCHNTLKANNVIFYHKESQNYYFPAKEKLKTKRGLIEGIKKDGEIIKERHCPYCKTKLYDRFGLDKTKYIALVCMKEDVSSYIKSFPKKEWTKDDKDKNYNNFYLFKNNKRNVNLAIYKPNIELNSNDNSDNNKIRADGIIFIIDKNLKDDFAKKIKGIYEEEKVPAEFVYDKNFVIEDINNFTKSKKDKKNLIYNDRGNIDWISLLKKLGV